MKIVNSFGKEDIAIVHVGETPSGKRVEFVEATPPPFSRKEKWVLIISCLYGCPINCQMCDASLSYQGKLSRYEIIEQIDYMVLNRYPNRKIPVRKFKIQFSRMGEPAFNNDVLRVLTELPKIYKTPGLMPTVSTIAPDGRDDFFSELMNIKDEIYNERFQIQFSIHSTDEVQRDEIMPIRKWSLEKIAGYGEKFHKPFDRKITLNFILADNYRIDPKKLKSIFDPEIFFIKMTPLNPTYTASKNGIRSSLSDDELGGNCSPQIIDQLREYGYDVLFSIGELEENFIGSNCGQYIKTFEENIRQGKKLANGYNSLFCGG